MAASWKLTGAYYYPGWKDNPNHPFGGQWVHSWWWLPQYPERTPLMGAYDESQQSVMDTSIADAVKGGLDYFVFNWYYSSVTKAPDADHAFKNFLNSSVGGLQAAIGFESATSVAPVSNVADWYDIIEHWATAFVSKKYLRFNGRPVVFVIKMDNVNDVMAKKSAVVLGTTGLTHRELLDSARDRTGENIYFVACGPALNYWVSVAQSAGYNAYSAYNLFNTWTNRDTATQGPSPTTFVELHANYVNEWTYWNSTLAIDFIIPASAGFNSAPWAGTGRPGIATPAELEAHLTAAKALLDSSAKVRGCVIDAWNEWGEGSYVQPCKTLGRRKLGIVRKVFK